MSVLPDFAAVVAARQRLAGHAHLTPVLTSGYFDELTGSALFFKCENFQRVGAFKFRGAFNAIGLLSRPAGRRGIVTHSSGNHGQAVALAARMHGYPVTVVMPEDSARVKLEAVRGYGARVVRCEPGDAARAAAVAELVADHGLIEIPPYDHPDIIAGQGTAAAELIDEVPDLDAVVVPVGGGGLIAGTAIAAKHLLPGVRVIGAEPETVDDAARSFRSGRRASAGPGPTVADGLRATLGELNLAVIRERVDDIVTVSEADIIEAMRRVWERMKIVVEPSAAVAPAALTGGRVDLKGRRVGIVVSGGNVDLDSLPWMARRPAGEAPGPYNRKS